MMADNEELVERLRALEARIAATVAVIELGYPEPPKGAACKHGVLSRVETCIACYDEALLAALTGEHLSTGAEQSPNTSGHKSLPGGLS